MTAVADKLAPGRFNAVFGQARGTRRRPLAVWTTGRRVCWLDPDNPQELFDGRVDQNSMLDEASVVRLYESFGALPDSARGDVLRIHEALAVAVGAEDVAAWARDAWRTIDPYGPPDTYGTIEPAARVRGW